MLGAAALPCDLRRLSNSRYLREVAAARLVVAMVAVSRCERVEPTFAMAPFCFVPLEVEVRIVAAARLASDTSAFRRVYETPILYCGDCARRASCTFSSRAVDKSLRCSVDTDASPDLPASWWAYDCPRASDAAATGLPRGVSLPLCLAPALAPVFGYP